MQKGFQWYSPILADNAIVFVGGPSAKERQDWHAYAVNRNNRSVLWDVKLPAMPMLGGLSLTRAGDVLVPLIDGRVVCIGTP